jgi:hypothetical protein
MDTRLAGRTGHATLLRQREVHISGWINRDTGGAVQLSIVSS